MSQSKSSKKQTQTPTEFHAASVNENGVLAEVVYIAGDATPIQFAVLSGTEVNIAPTVGLENGKTCLPPVGASAMARTGVVVLPSGCSSYGSQSDLLRRIKGFIHRYSDLDDFSEGLVAHFVLMTWVFDLFTAVPYLRFLGEPGTGKSRMLQITGHLAYKGILAGGATTSSPLFRLIEVYKGTLVVDEADYKFSSAWSEIIKILNSGYMKGVPVLRSEKIADSYEPRPYDVFGPKIIGNRFTYEDWALETRCITLEMVEKELRPDIPRQLPSQFYTEAQELRNMLLQWRFDTFRSIRVDESQLQQLEPRLTQIGTPIYSICADHDFREKLIKFLDEYGRKQKSEKPQAAVVHALSNLSETATSTRGFTVKQIAEEVNRVQVDIGEEMTPRRVGGLLRSMKIKPVRSNDGYRVAIPKADLESLSQKYILSVDEDADGSSIAIPARQE